MSSNNLEMETIEVTDLNDTGTIDARLVKIGNDWHADGRTYRQERASCDFWQPMDEPEACVGLIPFRRYVGGDEERRIEAVEQTDGEVYIYTVSAPDLRFTDANGRQYQEALPSWDAFLVWKAQYPGLR